MAKKHFKGPDPKPNPEQDSIEDEQVLFLEQLMSPSEYKECCQNLKAFFDLLLSWRNEDSDESTKL